MTDEKPDSLWEDEPPPTAEELAESARLRDELEDPGSKDEGVEYARALRFAVSPKAIEARTHQKILDATVGKPRGKSSTKMVWYPIGMVVAAAAALVLVAVNMVGGPSSAPSSATADLSKPHTSQDLFPTPFPREGETSKRVDAIVSSRERELRKNRYSKWGVH